MNIKKSFYIVSFWGFIGLSHCSAQINPFQKSSTEFTNPVIWADVPDLSITRNGDDFYLISTTMHLMPGARDAFQRSCTLGNGKLCFQYIK